MAEIHTLARPYAGAVFELATGQDELEAWSNALATLAAIVSNESTEALLRNPEFDAAQLAQTIIDIAGEEMGPKARNLVHLLAENGRLALVPAIAEQYEARRAEAESRLEVNVTSAVELSAAQAQGLAASLEQRLACSVHLNFEQDEGIIGGAIIRAGDLVIDGSLRAQLERMRQSLSH